MSKSRFGQVPRFSASLVGHEDDGCGLAFGFLCCGQLVYSSHVMWFRWPRCTSPTRRRAPRLRPAVCICGGTCAGWPGEFPGYPARTHSSHITITVRIVRTGMRTCPAPALGWWSGGGSEHLPWAADLFLPPPPLSLQLGHGGAAAPGNAPFRLILHLCLLINSWKCKPVNKPACKDLYNPESLILPAG